MRIGLLGGLRVEHDGKPIVVSGAMQLGVFFRLAVDAGRPVSVREIVEDVWGIDAPENERAALQSVVSRLRSQLPPGSIESTSGGYRLAVARNEVDALLFQDRVAAGDPSASELWAGEPWIPSDRFDWFARDLKRDRAVLGAASTRATPTRSTIAAPLTSLVGREAELAMIVDQLAANRLVTIIGTGGAGKTRLAVETARGRAGSVFVELASVAAHEILPAVLTAAGREVRTVEAPDASTARQRVLDALRGREILLVLDNCEHVVDAAAAVAADLLGELPALRILTTSREPLAIAGEAFVALGSLRADRAAELFRQRALSAGGAEPDPVLSAAVCSRLDGLPLALELAAAKLRTMTLEEVVTGLEHRFELLTAGYRTTLPRHQTLRAVIDWSWSLLSDDERALLAQLAVFPAGIAASDTAYLAAAIGVRDVVGSLVDRSLLQRMRGRYRALETIREYGLERLAENGTMTDARTVQALHQAESASRFDRLLRGPEIHAAIEWFDAEEDNIAAALRFATTVPLAETAVALAVSCAWYWVVRDREDDARVWFPLVTPLAEIVDSEEAAFLRALAPVLTAITRPNQQLDEAALFGLLAPIADLEVGPGSHEVLQLLPAAVAAYAAVADYPDWMVRVRVPIGEDLGLDPWPSAVLHIVAAAAAQNSGDIAALGEQTAHALAAFERHGDLWGLAIAQQMRAEWLAMSGRLTEALELSNASTDSMRRITSTWDLAQQQGLGLRILLRLDRAEEARERAITMLEGAMAVSSTRTQLQAALNCVDVDLATHDLSGARSRLALIEQLVLDDPPNPPGQMNAWVGMSRAGVALLSGDTDAAETFLRAAASSALSSHDHPVIGEVALAIGQLAVARADLELALRAVDLAEAIVGIRDSTHPKIVAIEAAAVAAGIERAGTQVPTRSGAIEALTALSR